MIPTDDPDILGAVAQIILGAATLVNSMLLWPIVKKLKANDEQHDLRLAQLEKPKKKRKVR